MASKNRDSCPFHGFQAEMKIESHIIGAEFEQNGKVYPIKAIYKVCQADKDNDNPHRILECGPPSFHYRRAKAVEANADFVRPIRHNLKGRRIWGIPKDHAHAIHVKDRSMAT